MNTFKNTIIVFFIFMAVAAKAQIENVVPYTGYLGFSSNNNIVFYVPYTQVDDNWILEIDSLVDADLSFRIPACAACSRSR